MDQNNGWTCAFVQIGEAMAADRGRVDRVPLEQVDGGGNGRRGTACRNKQEHTENRARTTAALSHLAEWSTYSSRIRVSSEFTESPSLT